MKIHRTLHLGLLAASTAACPAHRLYSVIEYAHAGSTAQGLAYALPATELDVTLTQERTVLRCGEFSDLARLFHLQPSPNCRQLAEPRCGGDEPTDPCLAPDGVDRSRWATRSAALATRAVADDSQRYMIRFDDLGGLNERTIEFASTEDGRLTDANGEVVDQRGQVAADTVRSPPRSWAACSTS